MKKTLIVHLFLFGALLSFLLLSVPTVHAAISIPIPAKGAYFGVWATDASGSFGDDKVIALEALINKKIALKPLGALDSQMFGPLSGCTNCIMANLKKIDTDFHAIPLMHLNIFTHSYTDISTNTLGFGSKAPPLDASGKSVLPDDIFRSYAKGLKAFGKPVLLRIFSEANSEDPIYPYTICYKQKTCKWRDPKYLIDAWRHIHNIFVAEGAANVMFMWIVLPYNPGIGDGSADYANLYPGDAYVDWVGWDVYNNWGFYSFYDRMKSNYAEMRTIAPGKPMIIPEFNSQIGGDTTGARRAKWFTDMLTTDLPNSFPNIKALALFNVQGGPNILIQDSGGAAKVVPAFKNAIASSYYLPNTGAINTPIPTPTRTPTPTPTPTTTPTRIPGDYIDDNDLPGDQVNIFDYNYILGYLRINPNTPYTIFDYKNVVENFAK